MERVYLSRKNVTVLLSKLNRQMNGDSTFCTIIKCDNKHLLYPQTMPSIKVTAYEDEHNPGRSNKSQAFLSRSDLNKLISILDEHRKDEDVLINGVSVVPLEDNVYYIECSAGVMHPSDERSVLKGIMQ